MGDKPSNYADNQAGRNYAGNHGTEEELVTPIGQLPDSERFDIEVGTFPDVIHVEGEEYEIRAVSGGETDAFYQMTRKDRNDVQGPNSVRVSRDGSIYLVK